MQEETEAGTRCVLCKPVPSNKANGFWRLSISEARHRAAAVLRFCYSTAAVVQSQQSRSSGVMDGLYLKRFRLDRVLSQG